MSRKRTERREEPREEQREGRREERRAEQPAVAAGESTAAGGATAPGAPDARAGAGGTPSAPKLSFAEHVRWLWGYWRPNRGVLVFLGFFTLVSATVTVAYPRVLGTVIDRFVASVGTGGAGAPITQALLILGAIMAARFVANLYPATRALVNARLERGIRDDVFGALMKKDYRFNNTFRTGDVVTRLTDDIAEFPKISWFGCSGVFRAVESSAKLIFCLAVMLHMNWRLTLLAILPLPIMMWVFYSLRNRMRRYMEASQQCVSKTNNLLEAVYSGVRIVKAFRAEEGQRRRLAEIMRERVGVLFDLTRMQVVMHSLDHFASRIGQMIVIAFGGFLVIRGELTVGTLFTFYIYLDMLTWPMMDVPFLFMAGQQAFVSIDRVEQIRAYPITEARPVGPRLDAIREIAFEHVSFAYQARKSVDDITFRARAGQKVALVGPVASGKSTVLKLVAGIINPQRGRILVNGLPMTGVDWESYRRLIGYVPQEALLFSKSIAENVIFGRDLPEEAGEKTPVAEPATSREPGAGAAAARTAAEEAWTRRCLHVAQMEADLATLPEGIETVVGQRGALVSGGQKQRIAIARALAGSPQVLLLDDCTAALDAHNEDRFWKELEEEFGGRTCFIVSHRLSTIRRADTILVFEEGRLVDQGTHEELVARCETYREFLQTERRKEQLGVAEAVG